MYKKIEPNGSLASIVLQLVERVNQLSVQMELGKVEGIKQELATTEEGVEKTKADIDYVSMMADIPIPVDEDEEPVESEVAEDERA